MAALRRLAAAVAVTLLAALTPAAAGAADAPLVLADGHIDVGPFLDGGELAFEVAHEGTRHDVDDVVLVVGEQGRFRIPAGGTDGRDWEHVGPRGAWAWRLPEQAQPGLLWAGFGNSDPDPLLRHLSVQLIGHDGPGEVVLWEGGRELPFWSTRSGLPAARTATGHAHMAWYLTEPGVHCLTLRASGRLLDGTPIEATDQLTLATAGAVADPATVVPCGRRGTPAPVDEAARPTAAAVGGTPFVADAGAFELRPRIAGGQLNVALVQRSGHDAGAVRRAQDVVFAQRTSLPQAPVAPWQQPDADGTLVQLTATGEGPRLGWSTAALDPASVVGDVRWRLLSVDGPGELAIDDAIARQRESRPVLSTTTGHDSYELWPRFTSEGTWSFSRPGVYCVALEWSADLPGGGVSTDVERLTFAVDRPRRRQADGSWVDQPPTLDPSSVTPCGRAEEPAGRTVLERGHVDVATRLVADALELSVGDATGPGGAVVHRAPSAVVLRVTPAALRALPPDPAYAFLGAPGDPVWVLPQVQDPDLLWPGWSTEALSPSRIDGPVRWTLRGVRGPGHVALWAEGDLGGPPQVLLGSRDGAPRTLDVPLGTHAHGNWGFAREGVHCLDLTIAATTSGGRALTRDATLLFAVGAVDATTVGEADCVGTPPGEPGPPPAREPDGPPHQPGDPPRQPADPPRQPDGRPLPPADGAASARPVSLRVAVARDGLRIDRLRSRGRLPVRCRVDAAARCTVTVTVTRATARRLGLRAPRGAPRTVVGRGSARARRPGAVTVRVRLSPAFRRALGRAREPLSMRVTAVADRAGRPSARQTRDVTLRP